jgi:hypothetical protein
MSPRGLSVVRERSEPHTKSTTAMPVALSFLMVVHSLGLVISLTLSSKKYSKPPIKLYLLWDLICSFSNLYPEVRTNSREGTRGLLGTQHLI